MSKEAKKKAEEGEDADQEELKLGQGSGQLLEEYGW